jgi:hypothetical protein
LLVVFGCLLARCDEGGNSSTTVTAMRHHSTTSGMRVNRQPFGDSVGAQPLQSHAG